ncbi:MAG: AAA family ATPase, partial [Candidatus Symbiothrix sp.]|nr:AAA family ATPase [Candidatus Symbiothrix sp.]
MATLRKKLPVGIQNFEALISENYTYVDKTRYLVEMIDTGHIYFMSRPRRFGKSLTVSTFDAMFSGKKELFKGLYAEEFMNRADYYPSPV